MNEKKRVKITDIARHTGFSVGTISKALQNKHGIANETRQRIIEAAQEIGYIPNAQAGALRSGASKTVAIIISDIANPLFAIEIQTCIALLEKEGYRAIVMDTAESEEKEEQAVISAFSRNVDGVLLCPTQKSLRPIELLKNNGMPFVLMGREFPGIAADTVVCNDENGGYLIGKHLMEYGHRRILTISAGSDISSSVERLAGFRKAASEYNISNDDLPVLESSAAVQGIGPIVSDYLKKHSEITAVFAFSDLLAWDIIYALNERGIRIPEDISVIGFDDIQSHMKFPPPLTTVHFPKVPLCTASVEMLLDRIKNPGREYQFKKLDVQLVVRGSTARC